MKKIMALCLSMLFVLMFSIIAFANTTGSWQSDVNGWWWKYDDGTYPKSEWVWIDGNGDGVYESYCFDPNGYLYLNTVTPDGYQVNGDGQWVKGGVVQTQRFNNDNASDKAKMQSIVNARNKNCDSSEMYYSYSGHTINLDMYVDGDYDINFNKQVTKDYFNSQANKFRTDAQKFSDYAGFPVKFCVTIWVNGKKTGSRTFGG